jgi:hypothetical protein
MRHGTDLHLLAPHYGQRVEVRAPRARGPQQEQRPELMRLIVRRASALRELAQH